MILKSLYQTKKPKGIIMNITFMVLIFAGNFMYFVSIMKLNIYKVNFGVQDIWWFFHHFHASSLKC